MKSIYIVALGLIVALVLCGAAGAASSLEGPSGIVNVPDTSVADTGKGEVVGFWGDLDENDTSYSSRYGVRGVYGVAQKWEVGAVYDKLNDFSDANFWGLNAKYQVMREPESQYGVALGVAYGWFNVDTLPAAAPRAAQWSVEDGNWVRYYVVASKKLSMAETGEVTGLIGIVSDRAELDGGGSETDTNLMLGLQTVTKDGTTLAVEWRDKFKDNLVTGDSKAILSVVARRQLAKNMSGEIGFTNSVGPVGSDSNKVFVGLSWSFGMPKEEY